MRALVLGLLVAGASALAAPHSAAALSVQEAILRVKPAVVLVTAEVRADVTMNCGSGPVTVSPSPFLETGTGWFVDGRGFIITNAHVVDPAFRLPPWVLHELKKKAIDEACVLPQLRARGLMRGERPDLEDDIRRGATSRALASAKVEAQPEITVLLSNGMKLKAEVKKFSPLLLLDNAGKPLPDSGRDLALLRVADGIYPAIGLSKRDPQIGDPVHILGFPGVVLSHELLSRSATLEAVVTNGAVSGINKDQIGQDLVQTDASAAHGNSGGPGVGADARLVGVLVAVTLSSTGAPIQGFNFLIPAGDVAKFLQGTEVSQPGDSKFNAVWAAGIDLFFDQRYKASLAKIAEANKLVPDIADVKRMMGEAERMVKNPPPRPFPWAWATLGVTVLSVGAYGGMWGKRWWKNRFRVVPTQVIAFIERGLNPVLLDVRTKTDFETSPLKLPGSMRFEPETAEQTPLNLEPEQLIVAYCTSPEEQQSARVVAAPSPAWLQERAHPQGRSRRLDQRAPAGRGEVGAAVDRARALQEPLARRHRAAPLQAGRLHLQGGRRAARRGVRHPCRHGRDSPELRRRRARGEPDRRGRAAGRDGALPRGRAALGDGGGGGRRRAARHQGRAARVARPEPPAARPRASQAPLEPRRLDRSGAGANGQMTPRSASRVSASRESPRRSP